MAKQVTIQQTPNLVGKPSAVFVNEDFAALIHQKGYDVVIESALRCPCKTKDNDHLSTCENCQGTGWVFINPTQDRAVISSINSDTEFKDWSETRLGTVSISLQSRTYMSFMDKVIIKDSRAVQSQILYPKSFNGNYFAYTIYDIEDVIEIFKFVSSTQKLQLLVKEIDYTFSRNKIVFSEIPTVNYTVSIRYWHKLTYGVLDIPHAVRNSYRKPAPTGREELQILPIQAIGRLWHYIVDGLNFDGDNIFDNSYSV